MFSFSHLAVIATLAMSALAHTDSPARTVSVFTKDVSLQPRGKAMNPFNAATKALAMHPKEGAMTNAQRLARGLPPKRPRSASRHHLMPRQSPAPAPCNPTTGIITITSTDPALGNGFVSRLPNVFGEYGFTANVDDALRVSLPLCISGTGVPVDIQTLNGVADFPFLGGVTGFANEGDGRSLAAGSFNYAYVAGTTQVPVNSPAIPAANSFTAATSIDEDAESAIWVITAANELRILPRWVNADGSTPAVDVLYHVRDQVLVLVGDAAAFIAEFGPSDAVVLSFVPQA